MNVFLINSIEIQNGKYIVVFKNKKGKREKNGKSKKGLKKKLFSSSSTSLFLLVKKNARK